MLQLILQFLVLLQMLKWGLADDLIQLYKSLGNNFEWKIISVFYILLFFLYRYKSYISISRLSVNP